MVIDPPSSATPVGQHVEEIGCVCDSFRAYSSGKLIGFARIVAPLWGVTYVECPVFINTAGIVTVGLPSVETKSADGGTTWKELVSLSNPSRREGFSRGAARAVLRHLTLLTEGRP
jgi:hypothetical protein